jgi:hypothetical protein
MPWQTLTGDKAGQPLELASVVTDLRNGNLVILKRDGQQVILPEDDIAPYGITGPSGLGPNPKLRGAP